MSPPGDEVFPTLLACARLQLNDGAPTYNTIYDVKFYPFRTVDEDQIFAIVTNNRILVYRTSLGADPPFEVLLCKRDSQSDASYHCITWTNHPITHKPLLCFAGDKPKNIQILNIESENVIRSLSGHGGGILDLAVSPLSTNILASAAADNTVRLWNLHPAYAEQPCVALFAGEGHRSQVLVISFHPNGRWLLSGGVDHAVCLWAVPDLQDLERQGNMRKEPLTVYYPHFFTQELHPNFVDCLVFYGDQLIVSRASKDQNDQNVDNEILIWKIDGFDCDASPPAESPVPMPDKKTRSSFPHDVRFRGFQRLLTLSTPHTDRFYQRFGLFQYPGMRPILAAGNQKSQYCFWDLQRLDEGVEFSQSAQDKIRARSKSKGKQVVAAKSPVDGPELPNALCENESVARSASEMSRPPSSTGHSERVFTLDDRFKSIEPHLIRTTNTTVSKRSFALMKTEWSPDGTWMVSVGDDGVVCIFHRDKSVVGSGYRNGEK